MGGRAAPVAMLSGLLHVRRVSIALWRLCPAGPRRQLELRVDGSAKRQNK